jgi:hypothetical protein
MLRKYFRGIQTMGGIFFPVGNPPLCRGNQRVWYFPGPFSAAETARFLKTLFEKENSSPEIGR